MKQESDKVTVDSQYFQFTLGPVQGFVSQARRTRDFWAGSFLLSWLASVAMEAIKAQGGEITFPVPDEAYLRALRGELDVNESTPQQGCIPNRFSATTAKVPTDFQPEWVISAVQKAWTTLAHVVWVNDLEQVAQTRRSQWPEVKAIWDRQVSGFWEMSWVMSEEDQPNLLDRRKNWRNQMLPDEPGHKCMMMDGWQELSGVTQTSVASVQKFWETVRGNGASGMQTDMRTGEQLCAMAFIKRRFARYFHEVELSLPGFETKSIGGWRVPFAVPSVSFIAAAPWVAKLVEHGSVQAWQEFNEAASRVGEKNELAHVGQARQQNNQVADIEIACVAAAVQARLRANDGFVPHWAGLDGQIYHRTQLQNVRIFDASPGEVAQVTTALGALSRSARVSSEPSPYYAILLMDGDQLGKHMGSPELRPKISSALNAFTGGVAERVREHDGFLVYAGGDDVLALLPMAQALPAAARLQAFYKECFAKHCAAVQSTLSGAIEYAHIRTPLTQVLGDAHQLLDDVAKEDTGRNAIACRVWKPSGVAATWAMPWEKAINEQAQVELVALAEIYGQQGSDADSVAFSASFFHRMKDILARFSDASQDVLLKLTRAEYLHSWGGVSSQDPANALRLLHLNRLLEQCRSWTRPEPGERAVTVQGRPLNADAALMVRFLAQQGQEREWQ